MAAFVVASIAFTNEEMNILINGLDLVLTRKDLSPEAREAYQRQKDRIEKICEDNFG